MIRVWSGGLRSHTTAAGRMPASPGKAALNLARSAGLEAEKPRRLPRLFGVEVQFGCAMRLGDLALQAEGREAEGDEGD